MMRLSSCNHHTTGTGYMAACLAHLTGAQGRVLALEKQTKLAERARASIQASIPQLSSTVDVQVCNVMAGARHLPAVWTVLVGFGCAGCIRCSEALDWFRADALCRLLCACYPDSSLQTEAVPARICCLLPVPHTRSCCTCCCHDTTHRPPGAAGDQLL
jgi:hypothetical protein